MPLLLLCQNNQCSKHCSSSLPDTGCPRTTWVIAGFVAPSIISSDDCGLIYCPAHTMAISTPFAQPENKPFRETLPMPPPLLHTRSSHDIYETPQTPPTTAFISPSQTPVGSPSKRSQPPGANYLSNVFDNALQLDPMSPKSQGLFSNKQGLSIADDNVHRDPFADPSQQRPRGESPTRQSNKENALGSPTKLGRDAAVQQNHAALSRQEQYQGAETRRPAAPRGLSTEDLQKLQLPKIKRLANVTQLCR